MISQSDLGLSHNILDRLFPYLDRKAEFHFSTKCNVTQNMEMKRCGFSICGKKISALDERDKQSWLRGLKSNNLNSLTFTHLHKCVRGIISLFFFPLLI